MDSGRLSPSLSHYAPLRYGEIRVLHLQPGHESQPLICRLEVVRLSQTSSFEALSYEWGVPSRSNEISTTDGSIIHITPSLFKALRDLRPEPTEDPRTLWADSIGINQDDIDERQRQVAIMGDIYRLARRVITYIGPEGPLSAAAICLAWELVCLLESPGYRLIALEEAGFPPSTDPRWTELRSLCLRSWVRLPKVPLRHVFHSNRARL